MLTFTKILDLQAFLETQRKAGISIGFVPTMGALHQGHISLIARSRAECGITVCSIFVNPTQFNDQSDLEKYPKTPKNDQKLLENAGCDVLFCPKVEEMYPKGQNSDVELGPVAEVLEGIHRPGHFKGVAQVVKRFFEIVEPHKAYFGSKDYQQLLVIRHLVKQMALPIQVVACPIVRESDGLAMSSRNTRLNADERKIASRVPRMLREACTIAVEKDIEAAKKHVSHEAGRQPGLRLEYFEICDPETLQALNGKITQPCVALMAIWLNKVRLIDNMAVAG